MTSNYKMSSCLQKWHEVTRYRVVIGAVIFTLPLGLPYYYGNLASYSTSYYRYRLGPDVSDVASDWMLSIFLVMTATGIISCRYIADKIGQKLTVIVSSALFDLGLFLTYFTVQHSVGLTLLTLMAMTGFCGGVNIALAQVYAKDWFTGRQANLALAIVSSGFGAGAIIYNQLTTSFINPDNLSPDSSEGNMVYFSQPEILDSFPLVFLPIGGVSAFLQVIGILLLKTAPVNTIKDTSESNNGETIDDVYHNGTLSGDTEKNITEGTSTTFGNGVVEEFSHNDPPKTISNIIGYQTMKIDSNRSHIMDSKATGQSHTAVQEKEYNTHEDNKTDYNFLTPSETIRSHNFYILWWNVFALVFSYLITSSYYKKFGEVWIQDDQFLAIVGSTSVVPILVARILIAFTVDRWGIRTTNVFLLALVSFLMVFWYPCVRADDKVFYLIWTNVLAGISSVLFSLIPITALKIVGHRYFTIGYGMLSSSVAVSSLVAPPLFELIIADVGWFWLFLMASGMAGIMVVVTAVFMTDI